MFFNNEKKKRCLELLEEKLRWREEAQQYWTSFVPLNDLILQIRSKGDCVEEEGRDGEPLNVLYPMASSSPFLFISSSRFFFIPYRVIIHLLSFILLFLSSPLSADNHLYYSSTFEYLLHYLNRTSHMINNTNNFIIKNIRPC